LLRPNRIAEAPQFLQTAFFIHTVFHRR